MQIILIEHSRATKVFNKIKTQSLQGLPSRALGVAHALFSRSVACHCACCRNHLQERDRRLKRTSPRTSKTRGRHRLSWSPQSRLRQKGLGLSTSAESEQVFLMLWILCCDIFPRDSVSSPPLAQHKQPMRFINRWC